MKATTLGDLFLNLGFLSIFFTILVTIVNVMIGVSILPADKRKIRYKLHRYVFFAALGCYLFFLWWNFEQGTNSPLNYAVFLYFLLVIPLSRRANVTAHAILASIGLVLLNIVAFLHTG